MVENSCPDAAQMYRISLLQRLQSLIGERDVNTAPVFDAAHLRYKATSDELIDQPCCPAT